MNTVTAAMRKSMRGFYGPSTERSLSPINAAAAVYGIFHLQKGRRRAGHAAIAVTIMATQKISTQARMLQKSEQR